MLHKLLIVTTSANGLKEMFTDRENAIVLSPDKSTLTASIVSAITKIISFNKSERERLVENAYKHVITKYSIKAMCDGYRNLILNKRS